MQGPEGKKNQEVAGDVKWPKPMVLEKVKGHLDQMGMLCSKQSWALATPSSFHFWEVEQVTLS